MEELPLKKWKTAGRIPLYFRLLLFGTIFIAFISIFLGTIFYSIITNAIKEQIGQRALSIAVTTANRPDIITGFNAEDPHQVLQPIAEAIRKQTGAEYVVIGNHEGIRYAHPVLDRIGKKMVGDDNDGALIYGKSYISEAVGSLGHALRGKSAIKNEDGEIIGVVSVGFMMEDITDLFLEYVDNIAYTVLAAIGIGIAGSALLARNIKKMMFGLEPHEIASLYTERNTLIETVREGIVMTDSEGIIKMVNKSALETLSYPDNQSVIGKHVSEVLPHSLLPEAIKYGERILDQPMQIQKNKIIADHSPMISDGKIIGGVSSFRLRSEIDQLSKELSQVKRYTEALRAQTHEYKNFLYTISGLIQLRSLDEALQLIHKESEHHQSLIQFIKNRLQDPYMGGLIIGLYNRAKELKVQMILDEDSSLNKLPKEIEKSYFVSILGNLVNNAFEAVENLPEEEKKVRILILDNGDEILMEVEDSGPGINPNVLPYLFKERISTKGQHGRGYGLMKIKQIINELGGQIYLEKGDLGGALFIISIPKGGGPVESKD